MHRLFVAVDLPDEVRGGLAKLCRGVAGARWVPEDQLHLTLKFIGDADDLALSAIRKQLSMVKVTPFQMTLRGIGHFPRGRNPRVLWVGVAESTELADLHRQIEHHLAEAAIPPEDRPFSPHITLARLKEPVASAVKAFEERHGSYLAGPFPVTEFHLYESTLTTKGAIHKRAATYHLSA